MAESENPRLTMMESKILRLGMKQHEKGYAGGTITPGFVRKETEYSYRAINMALESLISQELMEKSMRSTFRDGALVELDVYKITYKGIETMEKVDAGTITVTGTEPETETARRPEYKSYSKPWERPRTEDRPGYQEARSYDRPRQPEAQRYDRPQESHSRELSEAVKSMHSAMKSLSEDVKALHEKVDRLMAHHATAIASPEKTKKSVTKANDHTTLVLGSVKALAPVRDFVIAEEVRETYFKECERLGLKPKGQSQFTAYLKRLQSKGLLELKRMGCRNLGIKGHGSRVVVKLSQEGSDYLAQQSVD